MDNPADRTPSAAQGHIPAYGASCPCDRCQCRGIYAPSAAQDQERCRRCDLPMVLQPFYEGSADECWFCPCCKSKLQTAAMLEAKFERHRAELGMTVEEFEAHMAARSKAIIDPTSLSEVELRGLQRKVAEFADEWEPACEHDKENPWT